MNPFEGEGRLWQFVAKRKLTSEEAHEVAVQLDAFCGTWAAHGKPLSAGWKLMYDQIIVLVVNEKLESASGCSIDEATAQIRKIDERFGLDLFNRMRVCIQKNDQLLVLASSQLQNAFATGEINDEDLVLDTSLSSLDAWRSRWAVPFKQSFWYNKLKLTSHG